MVEEIIWKKDYTPEKSSSWSSNGRYEYVNKKYYKKCYFKINGVEKETRHKYLYEETDEKIDHYVRSYTDRKEEKTGDYIDNHSYTVQWRFLYMKLLQIYQELAFQRYFLPFPQCIGLLVR